MTKQSKVTKIEKKYKDKKTGEYKSMTIEYSKVTDRLKEFRQDCPFGDIKTNLEVKGEYIFATATIIKDKSVEHSATATGNAIAKLTGSEKEFEKLETLSVGRALAFLGYSAGGEIASSEEMEEFLNYQEQKKQELIQNAIEELDNAKTYDELQTIWGTLGTAIKEKEVVAKKDELKAKLK